MALEKRLEAIPPQPFTADGTAQGLITVADAHEFKVKQLVYLTANTLPDLDNIEIKRVVNAGHGVTATQLLVGPRGGSIDSRVDVSAYTVALSAAIVANEQNRPSIPNESINRAVFEEEPTNATRTFLVDEMGNDYTTENPLPVQLSDGSINIGTVNAELEVQLSHEDDVPDIGDVHDSVRVGDGVETLAINPDGSINVVTSSTAATTTPTIANISILTSNTEYSYVFPTGTRQFTLKDRKGDAKTRIAYTLGGTNTTYITLDPGCTYEIGGISSLVGFAIYFQSSKDARTIEIASWA